MSRRTIEVRGVELSILVEGRDGGPWVTFAHSLATDATLFDEQARTTLGITGEEFIRRWDAGEFDTVADDPDHPEILRLAMMLSFGR